MRLERKYFNGFSARLKVVSEQIFSRDWEDVRKQY